MKKSRDLSGQRFERLLVEHAVTVNRETRWQCVCDCGTPKVIRAGHLLSGAIVSCGCFKRERASETNRTHGHTIGGMSSTFNTWRAMIERCSNPKHVGAARYSMAGITVCERWRDSFENFLADMGERPSKAHSIDRFPNRDGNYEPGNCRWATAIEQSRNRGFCKLTPDLVREIHGRVEHHEPMVSVARRLKIGESTVSNIIAGRAWKDIYMEGRS